MIEAKKGHHLKKLDRLENLVLLTEKLHTDLKNTINVSHREELINKYKENVLALSFSQKIAIVFIGFVTALLGAAVGCTVGFIAGGIPGAISGAVIGGVAAATTSTALARQGLFKFSKTNANKELNAVATAYRQLI